MVPSAGVLCQEHRRSAGAWLPAKPGGCREPGGCQDASLQSWTVAALASWHRCGAARALCCLLNEVCCCMPGPGAFVHLGEEAVAHCLCTASQHHHRIWGWQSSLALRGVTHSLQPLLTGAGEESCASALPSGFFIWAVLPSNPSLPRFPSPGLVTLMFAWDFSKGCSNS